MLLRVDDSLHAQLAELAHRSHKSLNAVANEILSMAASGSESSAHDRLHLRAATLGMLAPPLVEAVSPPGSRERERVLKQTRGWGAVIDEILDEDRDRL